VANLQPVSTTPVANSPLVLTTPAANFAISNAGVVDTGGKFATSECWYLKVNLKEKSVLYVNSTTQRCKKNYWNFSDWRFFPFATDVNDTGGAPWAANISTNIAKKNRKCPKCILRGLGETYSWKNPEIENLVALSL
jgi:hypothetical protein